MRHEEVNKLIKHDLNQAKIPSMLEPIGLSRKGEKKRPDGLTYPTWKNGKCLIWDFICSDILCKSYVKKSSTEVVLPIPKHFNGNTKTKCILFYGLPKR